MIVLVVVVVVVVVVVIVFAVLLSLLLSLSITTITTTTIPTFYTRIIHCRPCNVYVNGVISFIYAIIVRFSSTMDGQSCQSVPVVHASFPSMIDWIYI